MERYKGITIFSNKMPSDISNTQIIADQNWKYGSTDLNTAVMICFIWSLFLCLKSDHWIQVWQYDVVHIIFYAFKKTLLGACSCPFLLSNQRYRGVSFDIQSNLPMQSPVF